MTLTKQWLTQRQVADSLRVAISTVHRWTKEGILPSSKISSRGDRRICTDDLAAFMKTGKRPVVRHSQSQLSPREIDTLIWAARGLTNVQIGLKMGVSDQTVKNRFGAILDKLGATNRTHAVAIYFGIPLAEPEEPTS